MWLNLTDSQIIRNSENYANDKGKWFLANLDYTGYFKVNYDSENWQRLSEQLNKDHTVFTPTERAGLIYDAFIFAK